MHLINAVQLALIGLGLFYYLVMVLAGLFQQRRSGRATPPAFDRGQRYDVYVLVPCLNEEAVIAATVRSLLAERRVRVIIIDDGSDDRTGEIASAIDPDRVLVARREPPEARKGKGKALNFGFQCLLGDVRRRELSPAQVLVCVMDADGRLSKGAFGAVMPLFAEPRVGGVQLAVRIRNNKTLLTSVQDAEFWGAGAIAQFGRITSRSVSLGGNGQFTRLSALQQLGDAPWSDSLTEDLDLCLALAAQGWWLTSTPHAHVSQQGVESLRLLLRQRTRWFQGHMTCGGWLPTLWRSRELSHLAVLEITLYMLVPWAIVLPWSVVFNINVVMLTAGGLSPAPVVALAPTALLGIVGWYLMSFAPHLFAAFLYQRRAAGTGPVRALLLAHLLVPAGYVAFIACWRALIRMLRRQRGWVKTARVYEATHQRGGKLGGN